MILGLALGLVISLGVNGILIWYVRQLLLNFKFYSDNLDKFKEIVGTYEEHLKTVYELETFYGDATLAGLLTHTKDMFEDIEFLKERFDFDDEEKQD